MIMPRLAVGKGGLPPLVSVTGSNEERVFEILRSSTQCRYDNAQAGGREGWLAPAGVHY